MKWLYWTSHYVFRKVKNIFFRLKITFKPCNLLVLSNGPTRVCKYDENCNNNYSKWPTAKLVYQKLAAHLPAQRKKHIEYDFHCWLGVCGGMLDAKQKITVLSCVLKNKATRCIVTFFQNQTPPFTPPKGGSCNGRLLRCKICEFIINWD